MDFKINYIPGLVWLSDFIVLIGIAIIHCDEQIIDTINILWCLLYIKINNNKSIAVIEL